MVSSSTRSGSRPSSRPSRGSARSSSAAEREATVARPAQRGHEECMGSPITVTELDHVVVRCRDQVRMLEFYTKVLGLAEERRLEALGLIQLRAGRSMIDLVPGEPGGSESANVDHVCLMIAPTDMDTLARYLAERGVETIGEPMVRYGATGYGPSLYLRDPEGNIIELK